MVLAAGDGDDVAHGDVQPASDALVAANVGVEFDRDLLDAGEGHDRIGRLALHLAAQWASRCGQHDGETDLTALDVDVLDHVQADEVVVQFRLLHRAQRRQDIFLGYSAVLFVKHCGSITSLLVKSCLMTSAA